jgi:hypothetical protein
LDAIARGRYTRETIYDGAPSTFDGRFGWLSLKKNDSPVKKKKKTLAGPSDCVRWTCGS